jgi:hypothetical protein
VIHRRETPPGAWLPSARGARAELGSRAGGVIAIRPVVHLRNLLGIVRPVRLRRAAASEFLTPGKVSQSQWRDRPGLTPGSSRRHVELRMLLALCAGPLADVAQCARE